MPCRSLAAVVAALALADLLPGQPPAFAQPPGQAHGPVFAPPGPTAPPLHPGALPQHPHAPHFAGPPGYVPPAGPIEPASVFVDTYLPDPPRPAGRGGQIGSHPGPLPGDGDNRILRLLDAPTLLLPPATREYPTGRNFKVWGSAEYLLWFIESQETPRILGSVPAGFIPDDPGEPIDGGRATNLFPAGDRGGERELDFDGQSGYRGRVGIDFGDGFGLDVGGFILEQETEERFFASDGSAGLALFSTGEFLGGGTNPGPNFVGTGTLRFISFPGQGSGEFRVAAETRLGGIDVNARAEVARAFADSNQFLAGFRYLSLEERLTFSGASQLGGGQSFRDDYRTENDFYGGQLGLRTQYFNRHGLSADVTNAFALGTVRQRADVSGASNFFIDPSRLPEGSGPVRVGEPFGFYTTPGRVGSFERDEFAFVYELTFRLGYQVTDRVRATVGYNFLYITDVVRPASAVNTDISPDQSGLASLTPSIPAVSRGSLDFDRAVTDFWAQGLSLGLSVVY